MATELISTIGPTGCDYTSVAAWQSAVAQDLVTNDAVAIGELHSFNDTAAWTLGSSSAWITDSTHKIKLRVPSAYRHTGVPLYDGTVYSHSHTSTTYPTLYGKSSTVLHYIELEGMQFILTLSSSYGYGIGCLNAANIIFKNCIFYCIPGSYTTGFPVNISTNSTYILINCLFINFPSRAFYNPNYSTLDTYLYNCTAYNCGTGFSRGASSTGIICAKNCVVVGGTSCYGGTFTDSTNNVASDGTAPGTNPITGTPAFEDTSTYNFRLSAADTVALGAGTDLSSDTTYAFSTDILEYTRTTPWDCGAFKIAAVSNATVLPSTLSLTATVKSLAIRVTTDEVLTADVTVSAGIQRDVAVVMTADSDISVVAGFQVDRSGSNVASAVTSISGVFHIDMDYTVSVPYLIFTGTIGQNLTFTGKLPRFTFSAEVSSEYYSFVQSLMELQFAATLGKSFTGTLTKLIFESTFHQALSPFDFSSILPSFGFEGELGKHFSAELPEIRFSGTVSTQFVYEMAAILATAKCSGTFHLDIIMSLEEELKKIKQAGTVSLSKILSFASKLHRLVFDGVLNGQIFMAMEALLELPTAASTISSSISVNISAPIAATSHVLPPKVQKNAVVTPATITATLSS